MPSREEMVSFLKSQQETPPSSSPSRADMIAFIKQQGPKADAAPSAEKGIGSKIMENVVDPVATALDYTYAPIRQAVAAPAKLARGDIAGAILDPFTQLAKSPKSAPTSAQVAEMYGIPKDKQVSPIVEAQPLYGSTYEQNPLPDDKDNVTIHPSQQTGALMDMALGGEGLNLAGKGLKQLAGPVATGIKEFAEAKALNATGATGRESAKFADGAGRELLDRKLVKFGDSQSNIADRVSKAVDTANAQIDSSLAKLEANGVKVDGDKIKAVLQNKIKKMSTDPSQADISKMLNNELENLGVALDAKGEPSFGVQEAEKIKRGYNRKAGNWADPDKGQAGKVTYQAYREAVEDAAHAADPTTAKLFEQGKKDYGLLAPIQEAAERRAATTTQSPMGGFLDVTAAAGGAAAGGPVGAVAGAVGRRIIAPRLASSLAVSADMVADGLRKIPQFAQLEQSQPGSFQAIIKKITDHELPETILKAADTGSPAKGPDKWAADGIQKLKAHGADLDAKTIEKLKATQKGRDLLNKASDLKPGTAAMDKIMLQIKSSYVNGAE